MSWQWFLSLLDQPLKCVQLPVQGYRYIFSFLKHISQPL